jgi:glutamate:Na+ symporter, ESS family
VTPVHLNLLFTILAALVVLSAGRTLVSRTAFLQRFSIPAPVVGGVLVAITLALVDAFAGVRVSFDMSLRDNLLLMFFTTVGLSADARMLIQGGPKLIVFLGISAVFIAVQNIVGIAAALAMDLHPLVGLLGGSITLTGGHGTGAAYGGRFGETMNLVGSMELTMACATAGLVLGSILGGPLAEFLITRYKLSPTAAPREEAEAAATAAPDPITVQSVLTALLAILACLAFGKLIAKLVSGTGFILPDFLFCLLLGVVIRNLDAWIPAFRISPATVDLLGGVSLSVFLVMALMGMRLVDLVSLAGPLLVILALQAVAMAAYAMFVTFPAMGKTYDAAVLAAGHVGFALSSTAAALAIMKTVTERRGPSPLAFVIVPMVGAFFIDIANALMIQGYLALPLFGFPA